MQVVEKLYWAVLGAFAGIGGTITYYRMKGYRLIVNRRRN